jgi:hypothetical protein
MSFPSRFSERAADYLEDKADDTMSEIMESFSRIGNLTGQSTADWVVAAANLYNDYMRDTKGEYKPYIYDFDTAGFGKNTGLMESDIGRGLSTYGLLNREGFMSEARDPSTVSLDQSVITGPVREGYLDPENKEMYDYTNTATQALIYGRNPFRTAQTGAFLQGATEQFTKDLPAAVSQFSNYGV